MKVEDMRIGTIQIVKFVLEHCKVYSIYIADALRGASSLPFRLHNCSGAGLWRQHVLRS
jgi:hypothetical protein